LETKQAFIADALDHADLKESPTELLFTVPREYLMNLQGREFESAVKQVFGKPIKITVKAGEAGRTSQTAPAAPKQDQSEAATRAMAHPEVQRFKEMFPDSQVRAVRDLRDTES